MPAANRKGVLQENLCVRRDMAGMMRLHTSYYLGTPGRKPGEPWRQGQHLYDSMGCLDEEGGSGCWPLPRIALVSVKA